MVATACSLPSFSRERVGVDSEGVTAVYGSGMAPAPAGHCPAGHGAKAGHFFVKFYAPLYLPAPAGAGVKKVGHKRGIFQDFRKKEGQM